MCVMFLMNWYFSAVSLVTGPVSMRRALSVPRSDLVMLPRERIIHIQQKLGLMRQAVFIVVL